MSQKLLVVGDTHANTSFAQSVTAAATAAGCNCIVQLGDWDLSLSAGFRNVWISWLKQSDDRYVFWLDGNHDDHEYLKTVMAGHSGDIPIAHWHERLMYCPRGSVTKIDGVTLQFMGGAYSIDKAYRTPGRDWWPEETITSEQEQHAIDNGHGVDIFFSHDAPPSEYITAWLDKFGYKVDPRSEANRQALGRVVEAVKPRLLMHGHYHQEYVTLWNDVLIQGVGADVEMTRRGYVRKKAIFGDNVFIVSLDDWAPTAAETP